MANIEVKDAIWQVPVSIESNGTITKTLATQDTYVDKNIKIEITTPDADFERKAKGAGADGEITATVSTTDTTYTSETETDYAIVIAADAHVNPVTVGTKTAGFTAATDEITLSAADATQATKTIYVKAGELSGTGSAGAESTTVKLTKASEAATGFVIKASGAGNVGVKTAGWVDPEKTTAVTTDGDAYYTVQAAALSNDEANADDYATLTAPVLTEDGYLFIKEGYIEDSKISLATLVPDGSTLGTITEASKYMYNTIKAYDNDGKLVTGTMGDATLSAITADDASATVDTVSVAADGESFKVTGSKAISGNASVSVATRGLAETTLSQTGVISGEANVNATLAKVAIKATANDDDIEVTPVIGKEDATNAVSGDVTTIAPAAGHYVAVSTAAIAKSAEINPSVVTEGYGTPTVFNATGTTVTAGAAASGTYYIPITEADHTVTKAASEIGAPVTTVTTAVDGGDVAPVVVAEAAKVEGKKYVKIDASATTADGYVQTNANCASTEGYITATSRDIVTRETVAVADASATAKFIRVYDGEVIE